MENFVKYFLLGLFFVVTGCDKASVYNNSGVFQKYLGNSTQAEKDFKTALLENPYHYVARYNLSMTDLELEKLKDALTEIEEVEKIHLSDEHLSRSKEMFKVYFAKAFLLGLIEDIPGALESYQKALSVVPDSLEVKNNIEILTKSGSGKGKKGKSKGKKKGGKGDGGESGDQKDKSKGQGEGDEKNDPKGRDDSSLKKKNLSKEEIEQILKEIKNQESRVRAKATKKKGKSGGQNEKSW